MITHPVTLTQGQSISLLTGKITEVAVATKEANTRPSLRNRNEKGLRANYLVALQMIIENDPMIPSADDLELPGAIFHSGNQG
jgi:hypothetical protein